MLAEAVELTGVVPAASSGGSSPPGTIKFTDTPVLHRVVFDGVGGKSAHFDTRVVTQKVGVGHPAEIGEGGAVNYNTSVALGR